jgi:hypothetical protein
MLYTIKITNETGQVVCEKTSKISYADCYSQVEDLRIFGLLDPVPGGWDMHCDGNIWPWNGVSWGWTF